MTHVFIIGSKGIPAKYGGFETFVENLTARRSSAEIFYHVSCMGGEETHFSHNGADCFRVKVPLPGAPGRIFHVSRALNQVEDWCRAHPGQRVGVYILGCRIGPLLGPHARRLRRLGAKILVNPDGLEWKRSKWSAPAKCFLRLCEGCLVKNSDLVVCDSKTIQRYIQTAYGKKVKATTYIAYGAATGPSRCGEEKLAEWYGRFGLERGGYYLIVGRFVPENNYETMIREFMQSPTRRKLVIVTNVEKNELYAKLARSTGFEKDGRIRFVGTVYDQELLKKIREEAYAYLHGHEVGGTNPSLLEALAATRLNLLLDVGFNREVGEDGALYWTKEPGSLAGRIEEAEALSARQIEALGRRAAQRINANFSWQEICKSYEKCFLNGENSHESAAPIDGAAAL